MTTDALVTAIQRRLTDISEQQHALAVEKARLLDQLTPLRLGILAPDSADRRPRPAPLQAVASIRPALSSVASSGSRAAAKTTIAL